MINMKVKEKAETVAIYGCMLTPGVRECKSDVYGGRVYDHEYRQK
jgi:hypothetical protein